MTLTGLLVDTHDRFFAIFFKEDNIRDFLFALLHTKPQGYKTIFMLSSTEHESFSANKYENANNNWHFHIY